MIWVFAVDSFSSLNIKLHCPRTQSFQLYVKSDCSTTRVQSSSLMGVMSNCCQLIPMAPGMNHSQKCQLLLTSEGHIPFLWGIIWSKLHSKSLWSFASFYLLQWVNHRRVLEFHNPSQNELQSQLIHYFQKTITGLSFPIIEKKLRPLLFFWGLEKGAKFLGKSIDFGIKKAYVEILALNLKSHVTLHMNLNFQLFVSFSLKWRAYQFPGKN